MIKLARNAINITKAKTINHDKVNTSTDMNEFEYLKNITSGEMFLSDEKAIRFKRVLAMTRLFQSIITED
jgi:hypothetical protein